MAHVPPPPIPPRPPAIPPVPAIPPIPHRAAPDVDSKGFPVLHGSYTGKPLTTSDGGARLSGTVSDGLVQVQCNRLFPIMAVRALMASAGVRFVGDANTFCPERGLILCHTCVNPASDAVYRWRG